MRLPISVLVALFFPVAAPATEPVDYVRDVKPILTEHCYACHGPLKQESQLRVDTAAAMRKGGDSGVAVVPGNSGKSLLIEKVTTDDADERMPAEAEPLAATDIDILRRWIDAGAVAAVDQPAPDPREHWAFRAAVRPEVPAVADSKNANPIDAFLAAKREERGLSAQPTAAPHVFLRRIYLDLIGLPPTREQISEFGIQISDWKKENPDSTIGISHSAITSVGDRLLESPHYGERWGRHWMDVWRYSDWAGFKDQIRDSQRHIWRWRDWIIESLNADKGYDRMILEMLAGDELAPADPDTLRATGFLARNWYKYNRNVWLDNTVEHTAKAFLGVTFNCARCHDHKYDPVSQKNYYNLRAFFEPHEIRTDRVGDQTDLMIDGLPRAFDAMADTPTYVFLRGNEIHPDKDHPVLPTLPALFGAKLEIAPIDLPLEAYYPALRQEVRDALIAAAETEHAQAGAALEQARGESPDSAKLAEQKLAAANAKIQSIKAREAAELAKYAISATDDAEQLALAAGAAERELELRSAEVAVTAAEQKLAAARAEEKPDDKKTKDAIDAAEKELAAAEKQLAGAKASLENPDSKYQPLGPQYPKTSTGRRLALALWITDPQNPLTARVAVNHIWLRHFGDPLVKNVFDFGMRSPQPRHAELLDWLAAELVENGWSMKHMHRLIVTSKTYAMTSSTRGASETNLERDPDNHFLWRMNTRRLEAEAVRDSVLHVAGNLDTKRGGPDIGYQQGLTSRRRSVYFQHAYEKQMKFLELFDAANTSECYRRSESIVPQQALALANSTLALDQSRLLARKLAKDSAANSDESQREFISLAFETILCRRPVEEELVTCCEFLESQSSRLADEQQLTRFTGGQASQLKPSGDAQLRAKENLVHVLMNHTEFVTIR